MPSLAGNYRRPRHRDSHSSTRRRTLSPGHCTDIDFMTSSFDAIPASLGQQLLLRHVHPHDPPGRTCFKALTRNRKFESMFPRIRLGDGASRARDHCRSQASNGLARDLLARHARLNCDLMEGNLVAPKFARDFLRMIDLVTPDALESICKEHRKPGNQKASARRSSFAPAQSHAAQT